MKRTKREQEKVKELAKEYKSKGYQVRIEPHQSELPAFLQGIDYAPDLIIQSDTDNIIIEVKSRESIRNARYLEKITQLVQAQKEWVFELVFTNPVRTEKDKSVLQQDYQSIISAIDRAKLLLQDSENSFNDAALLLAWSSFEGAARIVLSETANDMRVATPRDLVRDLVMIGFISRNEYDFLQRILKLRNVLVHGDFSVTIEKKDVFHLIEISESLLSNA